ncbi:DUF1804 family protein [Escherichia coli]
MAWSQDIRDKVRNGYIFDQFPPDIVAMKFAVPHDTARRWKTQAMKNGDDWDKLRAAHALAGDGLESVARTVLISLVVKCQTTLERLNQNPDIPPQESVELLASLSYSSSKAVASSKKILPGSRPGPPRHWKWCSGSARSSRSVTRHSMPRFLRCSKASLKSLRIISVNHKRPVFRAVLYSVFVMQKQIIGNATLYCGDVLDVLPALSERFDAAHYRPALQQWWHT